MDANSFEEGTPLAKRRRNNSPRASTPIQSVSISASELEEHGGDSFSASDDEDLPNVSVSFGTPSRDGLAGT